MRKFLILLLLLLLPAACGSATGSDTAAGEETTATIEENGSSTAEETNDGDSAPTGNTSVITGSTPQEASVVRVQDHTKGTDDPTVTIIEYGDFQ